MDTPSGTQWTLHAGADELTIVEVGGGVREWRRDGVAVVAGYPSDQMCSSGRGQQLIPWPNRIRNGRYTFAGREHQLALTEVEYANASHGLMRWQPWHLADRSEQSLSVGATLHPQPGWEWTLDVVTTYALDDGGLTVTHEVTNRSETHAPFALGVHPYVAIGDLLIESVHLNIPAKAFVEVDDRLLPVGVHQVADGPYDFRELKAVGERRLDTAYTSVIADADGRWRVGVHAPASPQPTPERQSGAPAAWVQDRGPVHVWAQGDDFPWLQVFTGKAEADQAGEHGVAVEPMTAPADAFNSGESLIELAPGQQWRGTWGISPQLDR